MKFLTSSRETQLPAVIKVHFSEITDGKVMYFPEILCNKVKLVGIDDRILYAPERFSSPSFTSSPKVYPVLLRYSYWVSSLATFMKIPELLNPL